MKNSRRILPALGALVLLLSSYATVTATHVAPCVPLTIDHRFSGIEVTAANQGASAVLESQSLNLCTGRDANDFALNVNWVSLGTQSCNDPDPQQCSWSIIQIGRGACWDQENAPPCDATQKILRAWGRNNESPGCAGLTDIAPAITSGGNAHSSGTYTYRVYHKTNGNWGREVLDSGGNIVSSSTLSPSSICWTDRQAVYFSEAWNPGDALGGEDSNRFNANSAKYQTLVGGTWFSTSFADPCTLGGGATDFCDVKSVTAYDTWSDGT